MNSRMNWPPMALRVRSWKACWRTVTSTPPNAFSGCPRGTLAKPPEPGGTRRHRDNPNLKGKLPRDYGRRGIVRLLIEMLEPYEVRL